MKYDICKSPEFSRKKLTFKDLIPGDVFRADGIIYLRLALRDEVTYDAISLSDGDYAIFEKDEPVELYTGRIRFFEDHFKSNLED